MNNLDRRDRKRALAVIDRMNSEDILDIVKVRDLIAAALERERVDAIVAERVMRYQARAIFDMLPKIYDRAGRVAQILGTDKKPKAKRALKRGAKVSA